MPFSDSAALLHAVGYSLGFCAIRHAAFMCDIDTIHVNYMLQVLPQEASPVETNEAFIEGTCNFWETVLETNRFREWPIKSALRRAVAIISARWPKEAANNPRVAQIVQKMNHICESQTLRKI